MKYWLMKSEPDVFSIDDLKKIEDALEYPVKRVNYLDFKSNIIDKIPLEVQKLLRKRRRDDEW